MSLTALIQDKQKDGSLSGVVVSPRQARKLAFESVVWSKTRKATFLVFASLLSWIVVLLPIAILIKAF